MGEWQTMDTVPMDGSDILVWLPADEETGYVAHAEIAIACDGYLDPRDPMGAMSDGIEPTHWARIPAGPSA